MRRSMREVAEGFGIAPGSPLFHRLQYAYSLVWPFHGFRSFSQYGEDAVLNALLPAGTGTYVDVGAGSPRQGSNTYSLYRRGWRGVLIEPLPHHARALRLMRPRDQVLRAACGATGGWATLYEFRPYQMSTLDPGIATQQIESGMALVRTTRTPVVPLRALGLSASPQDQSVLSIDTEGFEAAVLAGNDWGTFLPGAVLMEQGSPQIDTAGMNQAFLQDRGYVLSAQIGLTGLFLHKDSRLV